jgi:cyclopropane fatty-acyl-phospholipid synthase-like methyltransferase
MGANLTAMVLLLPLAYSVPPLRIKERYWAGVFADALAAHVFPAMLALLIVSQQQLASPSAQFTWILFIWSLAAGLRGILTHQFKDAASDQAAGLLTVAHQIGNVRLKRLIVFGLTPIEFLAIATAIALTPMTAFAGTMVLIYVAFEAIKTVQNVIPLRILNDHGHRYIPFVNEGGYKVWGPLIFALDAAVTDPAFLTIVLLFCLLFLSQIKQQISHVLISLTHLWTEIDRVRKRYVRQDSNQIALSGVITVCDHSYFPGLLMLHRSVQESGDYPVACYDIGLTEAQRAEAMTRRNLHILPLPDDPLIAAIQAELHTDSAVKKADKRIWPLWICPVLIKHAPFQNVIWLDCDLVVLRDLPTLFEKLKDHPVFTSETLAPSQTPNKPALYQRLEIARKFNPAVPTINAGVSGWNKSRDHALIEAYIHPVERAVSDSEIRKLISWHDQGALIWAIQSAGKEHCVEADQKWNKAAALTALKDSALPWNEDFLPRLRLQYPDVKIMHWNGMTPPWASRATPVAQSYASADEIAAYYDSWTDRYRADFDDTFQAARPTNQVDLNQYLMERSGMRDGDHVLDAGCGVCGPSMHFAKNRDLTVKAVTVSEYQVNEARKSIQKAGLTGKITVQQGDFHHLPALFKSSDFDRAVFLESLSHASDPMSVLSGAYQLLKPGGILYIKDFFVKEYADPADQARAQDVIAKINKVFFLRTPSLPETVALLERIGFQKLWIDPLQFELDHRVWRQFNTRHGFDLYSGQPPIEWCDWLELLYVKPAT